MHLRNREAMTEVFHHRTGTDQIADNRSRTRRGPPPQRNQIATSRIDDFRVAFRHEGKLLEPIAGQFLMDFAPEEKVVARRSSPPPKPIPVETVAELFARGIALEENPSTQSAALECY